MLASTSLDGAVKIWSLSAGNELVTVSIPVAGFGTRAAYSPNGQEFLTNGGDGSATLWNTKTGKPRLILNGHDLEVLNVAFSSDGKRIATASLDETAIVWDATSGRKLFTLSKHEFGIRDLAFSPDGSLIATGGFDGTAKVWDATTGALVHEITGHQGLVLGVAFSPDGKNLATSSTDATSKIWDVKTGNLLFTLHGAWQWCSRYCLQSRWLDHCHRQRRWNRNSMGCKHRPATTNIDRPQFLTPIRRIQPRMKNCWPQAARITLQRYGMRRLARKYSHSPAVR